ncbi:MAG TPA: thioesterase family protein [Lachnospiraceae bacterium]|nr:thioesterase family protein [Lachnospiraceae bacterium]
MEMESRFMVRYAETDQMGIVHHSNYAIWFEVGRTEFLKHLGLSYKEIEKRGILLPLYEMNCKFKSPAHYEDEIIIKTKIKLLSKVRAIFSYEVANGMDGKILATGETMHGWTDIRLKPINAQAVAPEIYSLLSKSEM